MGRTTMVVLLAVVVGVTIFWGMLFTALDSAYKNGTQQMKVCVEAGGSFFDSEGDPTCLQPGETLPR